MSDLSERLAKLSPEQRAALERRLGAAPPGAREPGIPRRADDGTPVPLTAGQERLWFLQKFDPDDASYNMFIVLRLRGRLAGPALRHAVDEIVRRHEILRTRFPAAGDGRPVQEVGAGARVEPERLDLTGLPAGEREARARELVADRTNRPFDLERGPLLRTHLLRLGEDHHVLCAVLHHIVADGWSLKVFLSELSELYGAALDGRPSPLPPPPIQYGDFAAWRRARREQGADGDQLAFWSGALAGAPTLEIPTDRPRPAVRTSAGDHVALVLPAELAGRLERVGRTRRATLFMTVLAAFQVLLSRHAGQDDVCVGSVVAGRDRPELGPLIGFFPNTIVLRGDLSGDPSFGELLDRTRGTALDAFAHQDLPFEELITALGARRDTGRTPLFQAMFAMQDAEAATADLPGLACEPFEPGVRQAKFDLMLDVTRRPEDMLAFLSYNRDLWDRATMERMAGHFRRLLELVADGGDPSLSTLYREMLGDEERRTLLTFASGPRPASSPVAPDAPDESLSRQAARTPGAVAVRQQGRTLTYAELDARAGRLAGALRAAGAGPGTVVGVCGERSPDLVAALFAVQRAGAAYLPLDPAHPPARLEYMVRDSGAALLLTDGSAHVPGVAALPLDAEDTAGPAPSTAAAAADLAYVCYTSGTTGRPKGVEVERRALASRVRRMRDDYGLGAGDRVLQFASIGFDTHAEEIYPALASGAALVLPPAGMPLPDFFGTSEGAALTVLDLPTSYWLELVSHGERIRWPEGLRLLILGADPLPGAALAAWARLGRTGVRLVNTYGPTETTIIATSAELDPGRAEERPPIGRPLPGTRVHLLDGGLDPVPIGAAGEVCVGGDGVARGYRGRPATTAERFVPDPFGPPGGRLYRTGDLARYRPDGALEFLGRADDQVKLRGYRIEPAEIESVLLEHPQVAGAAVVVREDLPGDPRLTAYVVAQAGARPWADELRGHLGRVLPAYMLPAAFVPLDRLPLTPNGKLDRAGLPAPERGSRDREHTPPETAAEDLVAEIWCEVLGIDRAGTSDDFFDLGGHSLLATKVTARLGATLELDVPVRTVFAHRTLRDLAAEVERLLAEEIDRLTDEEARARLDSGQLGDQA
ncbi:non-ribosomal peptide synthetase [Actinomadura sp. 7K507]|uniref:non-ribosomal peptide synthetase n=1 Tax=Actinomadura sp. 7K507 TaxID=2530365 RepID=UPI00105023D7|nr:non-ribosomal peptide synthetase [Actinomadura sp. 7K507]TDC91355.1 amino acid adenylation domain-containing protein [Actinomadura sp. 7K507]